jgi:outer membrane protein OmpA-like peptidoglycan-associated protein
VRLAALVALAVMPRLEAATLRGTVTDLVHGTPIPAVIVTVTTQARTTLTTKTNADGQYTVTPLPAAGAVHVEYALTGYQGYPTVRDPVLGSNRPVNIRLMPEHQDAAYRRMVAEMIRAAPTMSIAADIRALVRQLPAAERDEIDALLGARAPTEVPRTPDDHDRVQQAVHTPSEAYPLAQLAAFREQSLAAIQAATAERAADARARAAASHALDDAVAQYLAALNAYDTATRGALRSAYEQRRAALATIQEREQLHEELVQRHIADLRQLELVARDTTVPDDVRTDLEFDLARNQAALNLARVDRVAELQRRGDHERAQAATIARAERAFDARNPQRDLDQTRRELADRDAAARRLRMENELARIAATHHEARGLIVTLSSGVFFDSGKSSLKKGAQTTLTRIAEQLKRDPTLKITVEGHTDNIGSAAKNQMISEKRAEAVLEFLVSAGVPPDRVTAVGKGDTQPLATNKTAAGRQQNRRVELIITQ